MTILDLEIIEKGAGNMLGGSVAVALLRFAISLFGVSLFYGLMSESKFGWKKTGIYYLCFSASLLLMACIWYVADWESCVRMVPLTMYLCFSIFSVCMSKGSLFLSLYKLAFTYYLLAVFLIGGLEIAIIFFDGNLWADIFARSILIVVISVLIYMRLRDSIKGFSAYMENELDWFSVAVMILSLLLGIGFILNPGRMEQTPYRLYQIMINFFLTGILQVLVFRLYLHIGKEQEYQKENQLMQMNHRLLERQMEIMEEYEVKEGQDTEDIICANRAVNYILSSYMKIARKEGIDVLLDVDLGRNLPIPSIDMLTILSNAFENAIYGCTEVKRKAKSQVCFIHLMLKRKKNKLVLNCSSTCSLETKMKNGQPKPEFTGGVGVSSILKTVEKFEGEYDFKNESGVFVCRLIMNIPQ